MSWRQHMMALFLAATLLVVVIATAAKTQNPATAASQVEVRIEAEALLIGRSNITSRAKISPQWTSAVPSYEITSKRDQGAVWDQGLAYDVTRIGRTSIYVLYVPETSE
jgi:hypothetical protein